MMRFDFMRSDVKMEQSPKKPRGRPFQKGHQINKGREKLTQDDFAVRKLTAKELIRIANKYLYITKNEAISILKNDGNLTMLDVAILRIITTSASKADHNRMEWILQRMLGKVPDRIIDDTNKDDLENLARHLREVAKKPTLE